MLFRKTTLLPLLLLCCWPVIAKEAVRKAEFVWSNDSGEGVQNYLYFRNDIEIASTDAQAVIHLFAYSRYALYVNGCYINFGPSRSYPQHPYYDTYDISPYLKEGKNIIGVKVMNNYIETFQLPFHTGGFIAWGEVGNGSGKTASLATPGNWLYRKAGGYLTGTPRFTFATSGIEVFDARKEPDNWNTDANLSAGWEKPVPLKNQKSFGELALRTIPYLTQEEFTAKYALSKLTLRKEKIYNCHRTLIDTLHRRGKQPQKGYYIYTWIHSPKAQSVKASLSWGDYCLNGKKIENGAKLSDYRTEYNLHFDEGWNYFTGAVPAVFGTADFLFTPDIEARLFLSAAKKISGTEETVCVTELQLLSDDDVEKSGFRNSPEKIKRLSRTWKTIDAVNETTNPAKIISWRMNSAAIDTLPYYRVENIGIDADKDEAVVYDMGRMMLGRFFVDVEASAGTVLDITFSEDTNNGVPTLYKRNQIHAGMRFVCDGKTSRFESFKPYGARYLQITVSNHTGGVTLKKAGIVSQIYPYTKTGCFECSDPLMNAIWELGWRTLRVCSEDSYTDTPFRERGHYAGDMFPQYAISCAASGDTRLMKHTVRMLANQYENAYKHEEEASLADYPLINLMVAAWYIRQYNDLDFAREIYPKYSYFLDYAWKNRRNKDGLFHPERTFFEWTQIDKSAALTGFQALMAGGYSDLAVLSGMLGKTEEKTRYEKYAEELSAVINEKMWNGEKNIYYDGYNENGFLPTAFPNSSAFPIIWCMGNEEKAQAAMPFLEDALIDIGPPVNRRQLSTPYGGFYALAALYKYQNASLAEQYIRKHWGKMIYEADDTAWEDFNREGHSTMSHAWSGSPTYYLSTQVLGVDLGFPSYAPADTIRIAPQAESITWAKGSVPHPKGPVTVSWRIDGDLLFIDYTAPEGVPVVVTPKGKLKQLTVKINKTNTGYHE